MTKEVDVAIIGSGTSGLNAMAQVRRAKKSFVLINGGHLGTTCARVGCMPSKAIIQIAEDFHRKHVFSRHAIEGGENLSVDTEEALEHVRDIRDLLVDRVRGGSTDEMGNLLIRGYATFISSNELEVNGERIKAGAIVIATGSTPIIPRAWQTLGDKVLTTDEFFELETLPKSMAVIGLGVIGLELGQAVQRLGVETTGIDALSSISGLTDPVVNKSAVDVISRELPLWLGNPAEISETDNGLLIRAGDNEVEVEKALIAIGRRPNIDKLGLQAIGVKLDSDGLPDYDPQTMQVGDLPIYIAGDVNGDIPILHEASEEGKIAGYNASRDNNTRFKRNTPFAITFSDPQIATAGASWESLKNRDDVAVAEMPMGPVGRALIMARNRGVIRVYANKKTGKLLGGAMIAVHAESLIHLLAWSIQQELSVAEVLQLPFYHPVIEEALQGALSSLLSKLDNQPSLPPGLTAL